MLINGLNVTEELLIDLPGMSATHVFSTLDIYTNQRADQRAE